MIDVSSPLFACHLECDDLCCAQIYKVNNPSLRGKSPRRLPQFHVFIIKMEKSTDDMIVAFDDIDASRSHPE